MVDQVVQSIPPTTPTSPASASGPQSSNKTAMYVILGVVLLLLVGAGSYFLGKQSSEQSAQPTPAMVASPTIVPSAAVSPVQSYDPRITSNIKEFETVSPSFQAFIYQKYIDVQKDCGDIQASFDINGYVADKFARVGESCAGGAQNLYANVGGSWVFVTGHQNLPDCAKIDAYKFTKQIEPQCIENQADGSAGKARPNTNP